MQSGSARAHALCAYAFYRTGRKSTTTVTRGRQRTGSVTPVKDGKKILYWVARVSWKDSTGEHDWKKRCTDEDEAYEAKADKLAELDGEYRDPSTIELHKQLDRLIQSFGTRHLTWYLTKLEVPDSEYDRFYRDKGEFRKAFKQLNSFLSEYNQWDTPCAAKDHTDEFGDHINRSGTYFKLQCGPGWGADIKLSRRSMDKLLFIVLEQSPMLREFADLCVAEAEKREDARLKQAADALNRYHKEAERKRDEWLTTTPEGKEYAERERQEKAAKEEAHRQRLLKHPRADHWAELPADELKKLVWSFPTVQVAALFGVSDVAIGKRCKAQGITKPPLGFWRKVETGAVPHPRGTPTDELTKLN